MKISSMKKRWLILILSCFLFLLSQFYRASIAVISPDLVKEINIDTRQLSWISAAFFYAFAIMQIPISMYLDGLGPRLSMTALSLVAVIGAFVFATGHSVPVLVAGRVLMGIGMACNLMGTLKIITLWFTPKYFATLSALVFSAGTAGNLIAATPLVLMAQNIGWRNSFWIIGAVNLFLVFLFYCIAQDRPKAAFSQSVPEPASTKFGEIMHALYSLFRQKDYWIISLGTFCRYGIFAAVQSLWAAPFLINSIEVDPVSAGNLLVLMNIGLVIGSPASGWLSDRVFKSRKGIIISGLIMMGGILLTLTKMSPGTDMIALGVLFFAFGLSSATGGIMYAHVKELMPSESAGTAMTGINFFTMIGGAFFLQILGQMMQYLHPENSLGKVAFIDAFLFCALCLGITTVFYLFTVETFKKSDRKRPR